MSITRLTQGAAILAAFLLSACDQGGQSPDTEAPPPAAAAVDEARIRGADQEPGSWMTVGRDYSEQRHSPLSNISDENVGELGLAWHFDLETRRGLEATPVVVDGVMYTSSAWSIVYALDARSGALLWKYDPEVPREWGVNACCDVVNRGVAIWEGKVFVGTIDGRLVGLDAATGGVLWDVNTIDRTKPYTITGAPRVVKGKVVIGNGGAEMGVRGYVTAYDAESGEMAWRFYTVPGNPADGFENDAMEMAAKTWTGEWWQYGGGGTVWDSMVYDPDLNLLYIGVGNGSPWNRQIRSPEGGDNLFLSAIVALNPDTGDYVWHYQTTPGESWDYTATQHIMLADLEIDGALRKVLMQAPKNGFFYVIDRQTGALISAEPYVPINWASHVDKETGRPVENPEARYLDGGSHLQLPGPYGGHNWHPMSYSPLTGLVYIPALDMPWLYATDTEFEFGQGVWNLGTNPLIGSLPTGEAERKGLRALIKGHLLAWDPVAQKEAWRVPYKGPWNGGVLSTAGNLVFQGTADGRFVAYRADTGELLWEQPAQTGIVAGPMTYEIDGEQYVTVSAGWGGAFALVAGYFVQPESLPNISRVLTFKLGAGEELPPVDWYRPEIEEPPAQTASAETIAHGKEVYVRTCQWCHGDGVVSGNLVPDLRASGALHDDNWGDIVLGGVLAEGGMASFKDYLDEADSEAVRAYVIQEAHRAYQPPVK